MNADSIFFIISPSPFFTLFHSPPRLLSLFLSLSPSSYLPPSLSIFLSIYLSISFPHSLSLFHSYSISFSLPHSLSLFHSHSISFSLPLSLSLIHSLSLSLFTQSRSLSLSFTLFHFLCQGRPELNLEFESESDRDDFLAGFMHLISR